MNTTEARPLISDAEYKVFIPGIIGFIKEYLDPQTRTTDERVVPLDLRYILGRKIVDKEGEEIVMSDAVRVEVVTNMMRWKMISTNSETGDFEVHA